MTDLAGIRVITLIESDIQKVGDLIHELFNVHKEDSVNKTESLGEDKVGYRSVHFVCDIGETRQDLPEWKFLKGRCFEIQVRTALMHAWAEIEHDRGYKLSGKLPSDLARRFSLLSGLLESADLEFNRLTVEIENYANELNNEITKKISSNTELTTIGGETLIKNKYLEFVNFTRYDRRHVSNLIDDIQTFGIKNLNELDNAISYALSFRDQGDKTSIIPILIDAMLFSDINKYFNNVSPEIKYKWNTIQESDVNYLEKKYKDMDLSEIFEKFQIEIKKTNIV